MDSDYARDLDKYQSTTGYVFTLSQVPVSWHCTLQPTVALSMTKAEYMAMTGYKGGDLASRVDG